MVWVPKKGECSICGKEIMLMSAIQKYCPECRQIMRNISSEEGRKREIARRIAIRRGTDPDRYKGKDTECRYKTSCKYGSAKFCEYISFTGHSRLYAGYKIENGKCGAYKRGGKPRRVNLKLDTSAPVLPPGKLNEV